MFSYGLLHIGRPTTTYLQQDTGCWLEDLPEVMDERDK